MNLETDRTARTPVERAPVRLPRMPSPTVQRERITNWIDALSGGWVRLLVAPPGFGKTTVLLQVAHANPDRSIYIRALQGRTLADSFGEALGEIIEGPDVERRLEDFEIVLLDELENIDPDDEQLLDRIVQNPCIRNVLGATTRTTVVKNEHLTSGVVSVCTPRLLAFELPEIQQLGAALGLNVTDLEALDLRERCEGWPIAVTGALRAAHAFGTPPALALQHWKTDQRTFVLELLEGHIARLPAAARESWAALLAGHHVPDDALRQLEACGGPVIYRENAGFLPLRIVNEMHAGRAISSELRRTMSVRMFGTFECTIDGTQIAWIRRMDRRVFRYLTLTKDGFESKPDILEKFWPGQEKTTALLSLRTTCSNIKKAIANLTSPERAAEYFTSGERLCVNLDNITVDVRRFISHVRTANVHLATESWEDALYHDRQADGLYTAHLGWGDEPETWLESLDRECRAMRMEATRTTIAILKRLGRVTEANEWEMLLAERAKRHA
ncbi:MAG: hypothetical protein NVSMB64_10160 [Candidatus Velthaea sp.]